MIMAMAMFALTIVETMDCADPGCASSRDQDTADLVVVYNFCRYVGASLMSVYPTL